MKMRLAEIAEAVGAELAGPDREIDEVSIDSRKPLDRAALFVALRGPNFDGHDFVASALETGAAAMVAEDWQGDAAEVLRVGDTTAGLQALARAWRERFEGPVIGITGSNGKTIVKEMLGAIASQCVTAHKSPGSYNSQIGVSLSLLGIDEVHELAIIEAGISEIDEMDALERMIQPDHGVLTSVGDAHRAGLKDLETTAREKLKLFARLEGVLVAPVESLAYDGWPEGAEIKTFGWEGSGADVEITWVATDADGFDVLIEWRDGHTLGFRLNVPGRHNVENAAAAATLARAIGIEDEDIREGLASFELAPMRLEMATTSTGITLINDAYSSDPVSARSALSALEFYAGGARTVAILGDMHDLGAASERAHRDLGRAVARSGVDRLFCVGEAARRIAEGAVEAGLARTQITSVGTIDELVNPLDQALYPGDFVLFKGSRAVRLERAVTRLLESVAPTRLTIDLDAIRANYRAIRDRVGEDTQIMAVVKSFAYGNDATRVSQTLVREGVDALAVAYPDEAIPLRTRGLAVPILVTNVLAREADKIVKYDLDALVYSRPVVEALSEEGARRNRVVDVHLEVDTGMGRVGLRPREVLEFARFVRGLDSVRITGLMTHFAVADDEAQDAYTLSQIEAFDEVISELQADGFELEVIHAANTAALWRFDQTRYDMVRVGIGLYGYHPASAVADRAEGLTTPALKFSTQIIHLKTVEPGESVSYGRTWKADGERRIATIAAGYNDGFSRFNSNGGEVLIKGRRCPVVGTVCMDVSMVDVTDVEDVEVGDEVVLFGPSDDAYIGPEEVAARGNTINYEVLCKVAPRVKRIFTRES